MKFFFRSIFAAAFLFSVVACDKDFNEVGADIVGDNHFDFDLYDQATVVANNVATGAVQSNNLDVNPLGIYDNPVFGRTTANFVTQLELSTVNPTFTNIDEAPEIIEVYLTVPYYSTYKSTNSEGEKIYELDSIYGPENTKMKLGIYESGYFLRDMDHDSDGTQQLQRYYTDQNAEIDALKNPTRLNNAASADQNDQFYFSNKEVTVLTPTLDEDEEPAESKMVPSMRIKLDNDFFKTKILEAPEGMLQNNNVFKNYFRGLYFKIEDIGQGGQLAMLNFKQGKITMYYEQDLASTTGGATTRVLKTLEFKLSGNTVSLQQTEPSGDYLANINQTFSPTVGHDKLYLMGGQGAVATIDLFGPDDDEDGVPDELEMIKEQNWLINEASLTFHIDNTSMTGAPEPYRIYLYDINNKRPIIDYYYDTSTGGGNGKFAKYVHSGLIVRNSDDRGTSYKVRLTNYVRDLVKQDSTNVRLGLAITETISNINMGKVRLPNPNAEFINDHLPTAGVMNPLGTILYGTGPGVPDEKRLKLHIYYTKPN